MREHKYQIAIKYSNINITKVTCEAFVVHDAFPWLDAAVFLNIQM
jgi:hypothetical protein